MKIANCCLLNLYLHLGPDIMWVMGKCLCVEYKYCIDLLNPLLEKFTASTHEGVNIRMILITSLSGANKQAESIKYDIQK